MIVLLIASCILFSLAAAMLKGLLTGESGALTLGDGFIWAGMAVLTAGAGALSLIAALRY